MAALTYTTPKQPTRSRPRWAAVADDLLRRPQDERVRAGQETAKQPWHAGVAQRGWKESERETEGERERERQRERAERAERAERERERERAEREPPTPAPLDALPSRPPLPSVSPCSLYAKIALPSFLTFTRLFSEARAGTTAAARTRALCTPKPWTLAVFTEESLCVWRGPPSCAAAICPRKVEAQVATAVILDLTWNATKQLCCQGGGG